jgi:hypothetical protein
MEYNFDSWLDIMRKEISSSTKILIIILIIYICIGAQCQDGKIPHPFTGSKHAPAGGSSGSISHTNLVNYIMQKEELFCIGYPCDLIEFNKLDKIEVEYLIKNTNKSPMKFESLSVYLPKDIQNINNTTNSNLNIDTSKPENNILVFESKLVGGSAIGNNVYYIRFSIEAKKPGKYIIKPAILNTSRGGKSLPSLESNMINLDIKNPKPIIKNLLLSKNPIKLGNDVNFSADIENLEFNESLNCTLWSDLNGSIGDNVKLLNDNKGNYHYSSILKNLKEGDHTLTFKVNDSDKEWVVDKINLKVINYWGDNSNITLEKFFLYFSIYSTIALILLAAIGVIRPSLRAGKDFQMIIKSESSSVMQNGEKDILVRVEEINGYNKPITLRVTSQPQHRDLKFLIDILGNKSIPTFESIIKIEIGHQVPIGKYILKIEGKSTDGKIRACLYVLNVIQ